MSAVVEFQNVSRWYGEVIGVNRVTVTLKPGITGLLGPNGAGKSTMMGLMSGLMRPSQGDVLMYGERVWGNYRLMRRMGFCTQYDTFYERMTGVEFLASLLALQGWDRARSRSAAIASMEMLGMAPNMHRRIQSYSKGMRQRTKVALAIAHSPEVVILDEPLNGLDAVGRHEMIELVRQWGREGRNVIISSHVLHEIEAMTDNILMMNGGYLLAEGAVREVRQSLRQHPLSVLIRCDRPRDAAVFFMEQPTTISARVNELEQSVLVETRDVQAFYDHLDEIVLERGLDVSLLTLADENISSIFDYLSKGASRGPANG